MGRFFLLGCVDRTFGVDAWVILAVIKSEVVALFLCYFSSIMKKNEAIAMRNIKLKEKRLMYHVT